MATRRRRFVLLLLFTLSTPELPRLFSCSSLGASVELPINVRRRLHQSSSASQTVRSCSPRTSVLEVSKVDLHADRKFYSLDQDGDGFLSFDEWSLGLEELGEMRKHGLSQEGARLLFKRSDLNRDGSISLAEWRQGVKWLPELLATMNISQANLQAFKSKCAEEQSQWEKDGVNIQSYGNFTQSLYPSLRAELGAQSLSDHDLETLFALLHAVENGNMTFTEWSAPHEDDDWAMKFAGRLRARSRYFLARLKTGVNASLQMQLRRWGIQKHLHAWKRVQDAAKTPGTLQDKMAFVSEELWDSTDDFAELSSLGVDALSVGVAIAAVTSQEDVDWSNLSPLLIFIGLSLWRIIRALTFSSHSLTKDETSLYAEVFQSSLDTDDYRRLLRRSKAEWREVSAGETVRVPEVDAGRILEVVSEGTCEVISSEGGNIGTVSRGMFLGEVGYLQGPEAERRALSKVSCVKAKTDVKLLSWDIKSLNKYMNTHPEEKQVFANIISSALVQKMLVYEAAETSRMNKLDTLLDSIVLEATQHIGVERASVFLVDYDMSTLWTRVASGSLHTIKVPLGGNSLAAACARNNRLLHIPDCYSDSRFNPANDKATGFRTRNMLCVPVRDTSEESRVIGVLQLINAVPTLAKAPLAWKNLSTSPDASSNFRNQDESVVSFTPSEERLAEMLSRHTALLIESLQVSYREQETAF